MPCHSESVRGGRADEKRVPEPGADDDFGTKLILFGTRQKTQQVEGGYLEKAKVRRLGDRYFLVGQAVHAEGVDNPYCGVVIWTPLSDVAQIVEFDNLEAAQKAYDALEKAHSRQQVADKGVP
jgi:hypothetical protein